MCLWRFYSYILNKLWRNLVGNSKWQARNYYVVVCTAKTSGGDYYFFSISEILLCKTATIFNLRTSLHSFSRALCVLRSKSRLVAAALFTICVFMQLSTFTITIKPGFHYPSWRPELTARVDGWPVSITRQHRPCSGNRALLSRLSDKLTVYCTRCLRTVTCNVNSVALSASVLNSTRISVDVLYRIIVCDILNSM